MILTSPSLTGWAPSRRICCVTDPFRHRRLQPTHQNQPDTRFEFWSGEARGSQRSAEYSFSFLDVAKLQNYTAQPQGQIQCARHPNEDEGN